MKLKIYFSVIFFLFIFSKSFSQISLTLDQIYLNNQTIIQNCSTVDFGTTTDNYLVFYYTLEKPVNQAVGDGTIEIRLKYDSASSGYIKNTMNVASSFWNLTDQYSSTITTNIAASEIQVTGSSILIDFIEGGYTYKSCEYPLIKTQVPEFNIQPTSVSLACGSTSSRVFTAVNVYSSPGTVTYSWNVGTGWKQNGVPVSGTFTTTSNSITLEPASGTILPSNVSMTPTLNGVTYPTKTATVTRSPISQTITAISGVSTLCSGSTSYTFGSDSVLSGQTVAWSLSNSTVATLSNASNTGVTLNVIGSGAVTLTATISNGCGQSYTRTKNLFGGAPNIDIQLDPQYNLVFVNMVGANNTNIYNQNITATTWEKISSSGGCYASFGGSGFEAIGSGNCNNWSIQAKITATNSCGTTTIYRTITPPPPYPCDDTFSFAKNPMKSGDKITNKIIIDPCVSSKIALAKQQNYTISIFTNFGENVYNKTQTDTEFDLSTLKKGFYIVNFTTSKGNIITKKLIVD